MSGKLDVSRIKGAASSAKVAMPDKQIQLTLELPGGTKETMQFRRDLTVDYVKLQLCSRFKLKLPSVELELDGRVMADPLSLSDFPSLAEKGSGVIRVVVEGGGRDEVEEEHKEAEDEAEKDARDLASLNDEDLAEDLHHAVRI